MNNNFEESRNECPLLNKLRNDIWPNVICLANGLNIPVVSLISTTTENGITWMEFEAHDSAEKICLNLKTYNPLYDICRKKICINAAHIVAIFELDS